MHIIDTQQTIWVPRDFFKKIKELNENVGQHGYRYKFYMSILLCWIGIITISTIAYLVYSLYGLLFFSLIIIPSIFVIAIFQYILVQLIKANNCKV